MKKFEKYESDNIAEENSLPKVVKISLVFTLIFYAISFLALLFSSFFLYRATDPISYITPQCIGVFIFSTVLCGFLISKKLQEKYILTGLVLGITIAISFFILSLILYGITNQQIILIFSPLLTLIGSLLGKKRASKPRHRHRRRR